MNDQTENHTIRLLQELRAELAARDEKTQSQIGILAQGMNGIRTELKEIRGEMSSIRHHIHELAIAVDHHTARLDRIDQHLGLDKPKH